VSDIGGTSPTSASWVRHGLVAVGKTLTTPHDPARARGRILAGDALRERIPIEDADRHRARTTLVTNAIIERKGSPTALLATRPP